MIYGTFIEPFVEFSFMRRALVGCIVMAVSAAPIGTFLVLRRMSLTGDAMAHAILPGAAVGFLVAGLSIGAMTIGGLVAGLSVALLSGAVSRSTALREDTSLGAFYLISLALGVLIVSLRGSNVDLLHVLFGTVLALDDAALVLMSTIGTLTLLTFALLYRPLILECLDPEFLRSVSRTSPVAHYSFLFLVVLNLVGGFQALGTLMAVGIMLLPAAAAQFWSRDITQLIALAALIGILSSATGLLASFHFGAPSGPSIILAAGGAYILSVVFGRKGSLLTRYRPSAHLEA
jgi:zinc/manganese transport system permease protein